MSIIYVGGLNDSITESILQTIFISFGEILQIQFPRDSITNKKKGYAFIEFNLIQDSHEAILNMDESELQGRIITVHTAKPNSIKPIKTQHFEEHTHAANLQQT